MSPVGSRSRSRAVGAPPAVAGPVIPFTAAAHEHTEPAFDVTVTPTASSISLGPFDVPAFGFLRHIFLQVDATGGTIGAGVLHPDYPFNIFQSISLNDVNGAPIFGPLDGYATLWANILGAYAGGSSDPRTVPWFVGTINASYPMRIPIEISRHSGMGSLANQNAAAAYKVNLTINPTTTMFTTAPTTPPNIRIRGFLEAWTLPNEVDVAGRKQAEVPYAHGTTQYYSQFIKTISVGANTILLPRVGNLIRQIIIIARNATANLPRDDTVFPDPAVVAWDARSLRNETQKYLIERLRQINPILASVAGTPAVSGAGRDTGVFAYQFNTSNSGQAGDDEPTFWLPTVQSTRLEIDGSCATAGTVQVITNDVAPVEVLPPERFVEQSHSGQLAHPTQSR